MRTGEGDRNQDEDVPSDTAVFMSAFCTAGGPMGVAYANTAFRNLGLLELPDMSDLEGVVVQVIPQRFSCGCWGGVRGQSLCTARKTVCSSGLGSEERRFRRGHAFFDTTIDRFEFNFYHVHVSSDWRKRVPFRRRRPPRAGGRTGHGTLRRSVHPETAEGFQRHKGRGC